MSRQPDPEVARAIEITLMCQNFYTLPRPGGLFDQDSYVVYMMMCVLQAQTERTEREAKQAQKG